MNGTRFNEKSFTVPAVEKAPADCKHGWLDTRGKCVFCGQAIGVAVMQLFRTMTRDQQRALQAASVPGREGVR